MVPTIENLQGGGNKMNVETNPVNVIKPRVSCVEELAEELIDCCSGMHLHDVSYSYLILFVIICSDSRASVITNKRYNNIVLKFFSQL